MALWSWHALPLARPSRLDEVRRPAMLSAVTTPCYTRTESSAAIETSPREFPGTEALRERRDGRHRDVDRHRILARNSRPRLCSASVRKGRTSRSRASTVGSASCRTSATTSAARSARGVWTATTSSALALLEVPSLHRRRRARASRTIACRASRSRAEGGRVLVNLAGASKRIRAPHAPHPLARPIVRAAGPLRLAGISTTAMDEANPRFSGSDHLLGHALREAGASAPRRGSSASTR